VIDYREVGYFITMYNVRCVPGVVGDWTNYFTDDMSNKMEECCTRHVTVQGLSLTDKLDRPRSYAAGRSSEEK